MTSIRRRFLIRMGIILINAVLAFFLAQFLIEAIRDASISDLWLDLSIIGIILLSLGVVVLFVFNSRQTALKLIEVQRELELRGAELESTNNELKEFSTVVAKMGQAVIIIGNDDRVQWVNPTFEQLFGFTLNEVIGLPISESIAGPLTDHNSIRKIDESIYQKKESLTLQILHYRKDRSSFWANVHLTPILNDSGEMDKYIVICTDSTEEVEAQKRLEHSELNFRQITETLEDSFYLYNIKAKKYEFMSANSAKVMGARPTFFYEGGNHTDKFVLEEDRALLRAANAKVDNGIPYDIEYRVKDKDGTIRWVRERSFPILNKEGVATKNSGICTDITELKLKDQALEKIQTDTSLLAEIGLRISEELSVEGVIQKTHTKLNQLMDATSFGIGLIDWTKREINFPLFVERDDKYENVTYDLDDNLLCGICARENKNILIGDIAKEISRYTDYELEQKHGEMSQSIMYVPLKVSDTIIGVISVQSFETNVYDEYHMKMLETIALHTAAALSNASAYEKVEGQVETTIQELKQSKSDLKKLNQIGLKLSSTFEIEDIFDELHSSVNELMDASVFGIRIFHSELNVVEYKYEKENGVRDAASFVSMDNTDNYSVVSIRKKESILINDNLLEHKKYVNKIHVVAGEMPHSLIFVPMIAVDKVIGVITVQSFDRNAYTERHLGLMKSLSFYMAIAYSNAELYNTLDERIQDRTTELEKKNSEITASINYARRIQRATLPSPQEFEKVLPSAFVHYVPKDIVSGDFYRVDEIRTNTDDPLISFFVGDCTGHGVPGAALAILCSSLIQQTLNVATINSPGEALNYVRKALHNQFDSGSKDIFYDGMDCGFAIIDKKTKILTYAGAYRDCFIVRKGEILTVKATKNHVGYSELESEFETHSFQLEFGDNIYVSSDGYVDQFGHATERKFMLKRFKELIVDASRIPVHRQKQLFKDVMNEWQGDMDQTDDICLIGMKVDWD